MASMNGKKGVDISTWQGDINMSKVKSAGYDFVMIRCGWGSNTTSHDDDRFAANVKKAEALGMPWGVYLFSYACSTADAQSEVAHVDRLLKGQAKKGYRPTMPVAIDIEWTEEIEKAGGWNAKNLTNVATVFLEGVQKLGYYPMIYTGGSELRMMNDHIRNDFDCWFAQWYTSPSDYKYNRLGIWQYGGETNYLESNSIPGVGVIDKDKCYKDYPTIIKNGGYNGFPKGAGSTTPPASTPTTNPSTNTGGGSGSSAIKQVQTWLNKNYKTGLVVDGVYGAKTKSALVKALQTELNKQTGAGLVVDGVYGAKTNAAVFNIKVGSRGNITKVLQGLLICNGLSTNGFDGVFGSGTEKAVKTYQSRKGLVVDGVAGKNTFSKLCK